jgi:predicted DNA-binding protein (MmcQ/YjbR family)
MNIAKFDRFCRTLPGVTFAVQWGDSHVHKIGEKLFAMGNTWEGKPAFILKTTPLSYEILLAQGIATRAPYLTRGNWVRISNPTALPDADLSDYIRQSYDIVAARLPKATRAAIGIL